MKRSTARDWALGGLVCLLAGILTGCAGSAPMPLTETIEVPRLDQTGAPVVDTQTGLIATDTIEVVAGYTTDASVAKEAEVHKTLRNRDTMRMETTKYTGMKMTWVEVDEMITITQNGVTTEIMMTKHLPNVSYTPEPEFGNPLPTVPSIHPAWNTANTLIKWTGGTILGLAGIAAIEDMWSAGIGAAGGTFSGDGYTFDKSFNESKASGASEINFIDEGSVPLTSEELYPGLPEGFVSPGCSVESRAEGRC